MVSVVCDLVTLLVLVSSWGLFVRHSVSLSGEPYDDAAMLLRYSLNLAEGKGIVWNVGEKPVDGATDFLFMVLVAGLARVGVRVEDGARLLGLVSHLLTFALVFLFTRRVLRVPLRWALVPAVLLAFGPGLAYVSAGFGTTFFSLIAVICWCLSLKLCDSGGEGNAALLGITSFLLCLSRPEGIAFSLLFIAGFAIVTGIARGRRLLGICVAVLLPLGLTFFAWRWWIFGYPLPNPFYTKSRGMLHLLTLYKAIRNVGLLGWPFLLMIPVGLARSSWSRRELLRLLVVLLGYTGIFILITGEMNHAGRYQYPVIPILAIGAVGFFGRKPDEPVPVVSILPIRSQIVAESLAIVVLIALVLLTPVPLYREQFSGRPSDGRSAAGRALAQYADLGYTLVTTEAGLVPFRSGWRSIDAWGLNDPDIAHSSGLSIDRLRREEPEVIVFLDASDETVARQRGQHEPSAIKAWIAMVNTLRSYAIEGRYRQAAAYGCVPGINHRYYVRPGVPFAEKITHDLATLHYVWGATGQLCRNGVSQVRP